MDADAEPSDAEELAQLASALQAEIRRRRRSGQRTCELPPEAPKEPTRRPVSAPAPAEAQTSTARRPISAPATALDAAAIEARHLRERASACADLESLARAVASCRSCGLCETRTQTVFADGTGKVPVMFVGEAPGENEDLQGKPVGSPGTELEFAL